jgi:chromosome partitioning protein
VLFGTGKGGAGKTTSAVNFAAEAVERGRRVLLVDLDSQGDCATVLGAKGGDADAVEMMLRSKPWEPAVDVRPGLDLIPGAEATESLVDALARIEAQHGAKGLLAVGQRLRANVADYDLVVIDTPPARQSRVLLDSMLMCADELVIPTRTDTKSLKAIEALVKRYITLRQDDLVPDLHIAGVLLFGVGTSATKIREETRVFLTGIMGDAVPVFQACVTYSEKADRDSGIQAQTAREYAEEAAAAAAAYEQQKGLSPDELAKVPEEERVSYLKVKNYASGAARLLADYAAFTDELLEIAGR